MIILSIDEISCNFNVYELFLMCFVVFYHYLPVPHSVPFALFFSLVTLFYVTQTHTHGHKYMYIIMYVYNFC